MQTCVAKRQRMGGGVIADASGKLSSFHNFAVLHQDAVVQNNDRFRAFLLVCGENARGDQRYQQAEGKQQRQQPFFHGLYLQFYQRLLRFPTFILFVNQEKRKGFFTSNLQNLKKCAAGAAHQNMNF